MRREPLSRHNVTVTGNIAASRTLIFVNGLGTDQSCWKRVTPAFEDEFRLVLFDHVGSVSSNLDDFRENQSRYLNISGYASDLLEICEALSLHRITLVGHSLGGLAGIIAAVNKPALFDALVIIGTSPRYLDDQDYSGGFSRESIAQTYEAVMENYHSWAADYASTAMANPECPQLARHFADTLMHIPQDMMLTILCSILQTDHRHDLEALEQPVLILQSSQDSFVPPAVADYMHQHIRHSTLSAINAAGHLPHVSAPEIIVAGMREFFGAH